MMYRFLIVIEKANGNFSAYSPDLPGCVATGKTREQVTRNMYEAIEMHVRGLVEDKLPVPKSHSFAEYVAVPPTRGAFQSGKAGPNPYEASPRQGVKFGRDRRGGAGSSF